MKKFHNIQEKNYHLTEDTPGGITKIVNNLFMIFFLVRQNIYIIYNYFFYIKMFEIFSWNLIKNVLFEVY